MVKDIFLRKIVRKFYVYHVMVLELNHLDTFKNFYLANYKVYI